MQLVLALDNPLAKLLVTQHLEGAIMVILYLGRLRLTLSAHVCHSLL